MTPAQRRAQIAQRSHVQRAVDTRPRCEDCARVLTRSDYESYWDGDPDLEKRHAQPRCCEDCAEEWAK